MGGVGFTTTISKKLLMGWVRLDGHKHMDILCMLVGEADVYT